MREAHSNILSKKLVTCRLFQYKGKSVRVFLREKMSTELQNHHNHLLGNSFSRNKFSLFFVFIVIVFSSFLLDVIFIISQKISSLKSDEICNIEHMELAMKNLTASNTKKVLLKMFKN